ncbi:MAG TPA: hypothetical protein VK081_03285, partial [Planctomycetota bacterium]|nr:hypothetical protein [Planctomycetota bacterium]
QAHTMAFDERNGNIVMFGGYDDFVRYGDTWICSASAAATWESFGHNCGGSGVAPAPILGLGSGQRPWLGDTVTFRVPAVPPGHPVMLVLGGSRSSWQGLSLPFPLGHLGMDGCDLLVGPELALAMPATQMTASYALVIPTRPELIGTAFYAQAAMHDPQSNPAGIALTNGLELRLGGR